MRVTLYNVGNFELIKTTAEGLSKSMRQCIKDFKKTLSMYIPLHDIKLNMTTGYTITMDTC